MNILNKNYLQSELDIQFDVIVMNPPYQELKEGNRKSQPLWDKFVIKTIDNLIEGGYLVAVHPDGWRQPFGIFKDVQNKIKSKEILYLELHDYSDGVKIFGAATTYDFYCLHNVLNTKLTKIKCIDGIIEMVNISKMEYIPNGKIKEFEKLVAKEGEQKNQIIFDSTYHTQRVQILNSSSNYETRKSHISKERTEEFKYPCVYTTLSTDVVNFWYSNTNEKGHFGIPKVIWSNGTASKPIIDFNGEYGLTQFAYAIVDDIDNLPYIQKAMLNPKFIEIMNFRNGNGHKFGHRYNHKVISLLRKDFWKEFI
jgi:hypothetical protein